LHPTQGQLVLGGQFLGQCQHLGGAAKRQALRCFVGLFFVFGRRFVFAIMSLARVLRSLGWGLAGCIGFGNRNGWACEYQRQKQRCNGRPIFSGAVRWLDLTQAKQLQKIEIERGSMGFHAGVSVAKSQTRMLS
jgi:hypothetical protein